MTTWNPSVGDPAWVYSFGHWYFGTVAKLSAKRLWVEYTTGTGVTRTKPYNRQDTRIAPATGNGRPSTTPHYPFKREAVAS
jgi:hypothetical protein